MPAEWEPHKGTWIAWPHLESDYPGKLDAVRWAYCELVRHLCSREEVHVLCATDALEQDAQARMQRLSITGQISYHRAEYNRAWLRDSGPIGVTDTSSSQQVWAHFTFNGWGALPGFEHDQKIPAAVSELSKRPLSTRISKWRESILEGGMLDVNGEGLIMVTEECLLSPSQQRNAQFTKSDYESLFAECLGATETIWVPFGIVGDDTHGHIDNVARFVNKDTVIVSTSIESDMEQYRRTSANYAFLKNFRTKTGSALNIIELPLPVPRYCDGERLACGYANFYLCNGAVLVPTFNDIGDANALKTLAEVFPDREVIGIYCGDWILGGGALHCSTQQEPL